jgi:hypothetical protein
VVIPRPRTSNSDVARGRSARTPELSSQPYRYRFVISGFTINNKAKEATLCSGHTRTLTAARLTLLGAKRSF